MISEKLINKKILVTGGAGFIGSNICSFLLNNKIKVRCLDNFSTGYRKNIQSFLSNPFFELIEGDIRDFDICLEACSDINYVLHHAALGSVPRSIEDPILSNSVNVSGFLNILHASKKQNVEKFIFASSSSVYGDSQIFPKVESNIGNPQSPYAITKYNNELYAFAYSSLFNLNTIGFRYFNVYGPNQDPNSEYSAVIPKFISTMIKNEEPIINGDGLISRDFTFVDDVINANILAILSKKNGHSIYNVGYGAETNLNDLSNKIKNIICEFDKKVCGINIKHGPDRVGDVKRSLSCLKKIKNELNYEPKYDINFGLRKTISRFFKI